MEPVAEILLLIGVITMFITTEKAIIILMVRFIRAENCCYWLMMKKRQNIIKWKMAGWLLLIPFVSVLYDVENVVRVRTVEAGYDALHGEDD